MAKTNYTKVEESFNDGLRKILVGQLLNEADAYQGKAIPPGPGAEKKRVLLALKYELKFLQKIGLDPYKKLNVNKKKLVHWLKHPETISEDDWKVVLEYKKGTEKMKEPLSPKIGKPTEEEALAEEEEDALVHTARKKSVYKRFNINDKWLPLH